MEFQHEELCPAVASSAQHQVLAKLAVRAEVTECYFAQTWRGGAAASVGGSGPPRPITGYTSAVETVENLNLADVM